MEHAQKPDSVFRRNGRVHLNRRGHQFSRLLAAEVCASALVMLHTPCSVVAWEYWLPTPFASFPFTSPPVRHRVPSGSERALARKSISYLTSQSFAFVKLKKHFSMWMMNQACNDGSNLAHFSMNIGFPWFLDLKQTYKSNFKVNIKQTN